MSHNSIRGCARLSVGQLVRHLFFGGHKRRQRTTYAVYPSLFFADYGKGRALADLKGMVVQEKKFAHADAQERAPAEALCGVLVQEKKLAHGVAQERGVK